MPKRTKSKNDLEWRREVAISDFFCACPECGGDETTFVPTFEKGSDALVHLDIMCKGCGAHRVVYDPERDGFRTEGEGAPYIPEATDISITRLHRFDPTKYDSEEGAIRAEMDLLCDCTEICDDFELDGLSDEYDRRILDLYERAYELGMDDFLLAHILHLIIDAEGDAGSVDRCICISERMGFEDRCELLSECDRLERCFPGVKRMTKELTLHILTELEEDADVAVQLQRFARAACAIDRTDPKRSDGLLARAIALAGSIDDKDMRDRELALLYVQRMPKLGYGDELEREFEHVFRFRGRLTILCLEAVIHYAEEAIPNGMHGAKLKAAIDDLIGMVRGVLKGGKADIIPLDLQFYMANLLWLRYEIEGNVRDLVSAANEAIGSIASHENERSEDLLVTCILDGRMPPSERKRIYGKAVVNGIDMDGLFADAGMIVHPDTEPGPNAKGKHRKGKGISIERNYYGW